MVGTLGEWQRSSNQTDCKGSPLWRSPQKQSEKERLEASRHSALRLLHGWKGQSRWRTATSIVRSTPGVLHQPLKWLKEHSGATPTEMVLLCFRAASEGPRPMADVPMRIGPAGGAWGHCRAGPNYLSDWGQSVTLLNKKRLEADNMFITCWLLSQQWISWVVHC